MTEAYKMPFCPESQSVKAPSFLLQVNCPASGSILVRLQQLSPTANGYAKLALLNVAGSGGVTAVGFAPAGSQVRFALPYGSAGATLPI